MVVYGLRLSFVGWWVYFLKEVRRGSGGGIVIDDVYFLV